MKIGDETMEGYCKIENKITTWKRLPNKKYICTSSGCSMCSGQYEKPPKQPKLPKPDYLMLGHLKWKPQKNQK